MVAAVIAVQAGLLALAAGITVWGPLGNADTLPEVRVAPPLVSRKLELDVAVAAFNEAAGPPVTRDLLTSEALLPDMPVVAPGPTPEAPTQADALLADASALFGDGWAAAVPGMDGAGENVSLLGLEDRAERIVVMFDVSASVVRRAESAGIPMTMIRDEAARLIDGLSPSVLFGLIQFSRAYDSFRPHLVPGTQANRHAAQEWLRTQFVTDGRSRRGWIRGRPDGILTILEAAFQLEPDLIFILSDASFEYTREDGGEAKVAWDDLTHRARGWRAASGREPRVHMINFRPRADDLEGSRNFTRTLGGRTREL